MNPGRNPKDQVYGELAEGVSPSRTSSPPLKDICKRDMKLSGISVNKRESHEDDRAHWRATVLKA